MSSSLCVSSKLFCLCRPRDCDNDCCASCTRSPRPRVCGASPRRNTSPGNCAMVVACASCRRPSPSGSRSRLRMRSARCWLHMTWCLISRPISENLGSGPSHLPPRVRESISIRRSSRHSSQSSGPTSGTPSESLEVLTESGSLLNATAARSGLDLTSGGAG